MTAILSANENDFYAFPLPIVVWCWQRLGIGVIVLTPDKVGQKIILAKKACSNLAKFHTFSCEKRKEATYSQTSRLFGATVVDDENEILITGDADLAVFGSSFEQLGNGEVTIMGTDLLSHEMNQYPMCFIGMPAKTWKNVFCINGQSLQEALDDTVGNLESINFRGDFWGYDQWLAHESIKRSGYQVKEIPRARPGTQFASNRVDRDDINWRHYVNESLIDAHLWRPGYEENNFKNIMELLTMMYPMDNFDWVREYREQYIKLL